MNNTIRAMDYLIERDSQLNFAFHTGEKKFIYTNQAFNEFFESAGTDAAPEQLLAYVHPKDMDYLLIAYQEMGENFRMDKIEFRLIIQQRTYHLSMCAIVDPEHAEIMMGRLQDITEQKLYQNKLLEFMNKKNAVLNIISHDLAGPLGAIQVLIEMLKKRINDHAEPKLLKLISMIESNTKRGIKMIQEFLKKEFLESVGVELQRKRYNLVEKMEQLIDEYKSSELHLNLRFAFNCFHSEVYVQIDELKFMQAINNLISNAIKFTPDNGTITVGIKVQAKQVIISIADTGIGIPEKFHEKLFDKFNLAGRTGLKGEHSVGLGMSIIKTIVEWHDGTIWFQSKEQIGTTFFIQLEQSA